MPTTPHDAVIVGGGHNGLTAAAYLARAGRSVLLLEAADHLGGASVSAPVFPGVDARLSRYSYLVSLLPQQVVTELDLDVRLVRRSVSSYTPDPRTGGRTGLLVADDRDATAASFARIGAAADHRAWEELYADVAQVADVVWPTVTGPLPRAREVREAVGDRMWRALVEEPVGREVLARLGDDLVRGVVLTDALIGTFADVMTDLRANRCFLYHVIGGGTGDWDVPVGGMGAVSGALARAAQRAGADLRTDARVVALDPDGRLTVDRDGTEETVTAGTVVWAAAPAHLAAALAASGADGADARATGSHDVAAEPEGAQLKVNMLLTRLPRLKDAGVRPEDAFAGTFHVNETASQLATAHAEAAAGRIPAVPPCEVYCHTLSDRSILGPGLRASDAQTMTVFGLHMPARLFREDPERARAEALEATLRSIGSVLAEPLEGVLATGPDGAPCLEARTPVDLEREVGLPGGHIFHRDLSWPWADSPADSGAWGVETSHDRVLLAGAGARRGGGVSGIPGRSAALAVLSREH